MTAENDFPPPGTTSSTRKPGDVRNGQSPPPRPLAIPLVNVRVSDWLFRRTLLKQEIRSQSSLARRTLLDKSIIAPFFRLHAGQRACMSKMFVVLVTDQGI